MVMVVMVVVIMIEDGNCVDGCGDEKGGCRYGGCGNVDCGYGGCGNGGCGYGSGQNLKSNQIGLFPQVIDTGDTK